MPPGASGSGTPMTLLMSAAVCWQCCLRWASMKVRNGLAHTRSWSTAPVACNCAATWRDFYGIVQYTTVFAIVCMPQEDCVHSSHHTEHIALHICIIMAACD